MTRRARSLSTRRLLLRSLRHHRGHTVATVLVSAVIAAGAAFVPWYAGLVDDSVTRTAFTPAGGGTLRLTSPGTVDLPALLPPGSDHLFEEPVTGRHADLEWTATNRGKPVQGGITSRAGICAHLRMEEGSCPADADADETGGAQEGRGDGTLPDGTVPVAVSGDDAERYELSPGDVLPEVDTTDEPVDYTVVGVYSLRDPTDPYWFEVLPTGRSGWTGPQLDVPVADLFVSTRAGVLVGADRSVQDSMDLRVDAGQVTAADVPELEAVLAHLREAIRGTPAGLVTAMDDTVAHLDDAWRVSATTMLVTAAQVAVLAVAVLAMLVSVALVQRRPELGLSRLRGRGTRPLVRMLAAQWAVLAGLGAVLGAGFGWAATALARSRWLPTSPPLAPPLGTWWALLGSVLAALVVLVLLARPVVNEPVPALLRATGLRAAAGGQRTLVDVVLVTAAGCGLAVGLQSDEESALALLAPSLLAVAASVLLVRLLTRVTARLATRWLARGRAARMLAAVLISRGRGTRLLLTVLCMSSAFAVFGTQLGVVSEANRTHRAEVEAGAAAVARTEAPPARVEAVLEEVDPGRERAALVVTSAAPAADGLGAVYVDPGAFQRVAYGARDAAPPADWDGIVAPGDGRPELVGDELAVTVQPRRMQVGPEPVTIAVSVDYVHAEGFLSTARLGSVPADSATPARLSAPLQCREPCRLLRWRFDPTDDVAGTLELTDVRTASGRADVPVLPAAGDEAPLEWPVLAGAGVEASVEVGPGTVRLTGGSGGTPVEAQHPSVPERTPVLLARDHPPGAGSSNPTVPSPQGLALPVDPVATLDEAVPRAVRGVVVADVASVLRRGEYRLSGRSETQVWYAEGVDREALDAELADHGVEVTHLDSVARHLAEHESSAEALASRVLIPAALLALLLAALSLAVSVAATWRSATRDLAALRMVGIARGALVRAACGVYLTVVVAAVLTGTACGLVGFALAVKRTPMFTTPEPEIPLDLAPHWVPGLLAPVALLLVLGTVAVLCGRWLVARSTLPRLREAGE